MGMKSLEVRLMARKRQKKSEPELIVVKILFVLGGAIVGTFPGWLALPISAWSFNNAFTTVLFGGLVGAVLGWLWANREIWRD